MGELRGDLGVAMTTLSRKLDKLTILQQNTTSELETLRSRQAVSGGLQAISLTILFLWLVTLMVRAIIRCVAKKQEARQEEMLEMMEKSLQERKTKRRAAAKPVPSDK